VLPPEFFHFLKHIPVAKTQLAIAAAAGAAAAPTDDVVKLKCKVLGMKSKDFTPAHAKALLTRQEEKGLSDWQPVAAYAAETDSDK
jgi:uncharacterized protein YfiM (DUF2279 family)